MASLIKNKRGVNCMPTYSTTADNYQSFLPPVFLSQDTSELSETNLVEKFKISDAYLKKLESFINGAKYVLDHKGLQRGICETLKAKVGLLYGKKLEKWRLFLEATKQQQLTQKEFQKIFSVELQNLFYNELPAASGLSTKDIALGEAMYMWQHSENEPIKTEFRRTLNDAESEAKSETKSEAKGSLIITQTETVRTSRLTDSQKDELIKIRSSVVGSHPLWFQVLPKWMQNALKKIVPQGRNGDWSKYEKFHPTTLRQIPGEANATVHEFKIEVVEDGKPIVRLDTQVLRQGASTSFYMKDAKERQESAMQNLQQMIDNQLLSFEEQFQKIWGISVAKFLSENKDIPAYPIFLGGLLTPAQQASRKGRWLDKLSWMSEVDYCENGTRLTQEKSKAVDELKINLSKAKNKDSKDGKGQAKLKYKIFNLNFAVNSLRNKQNAVVDKDFINCAERFYAGLSALEIAKEPSLALRIKMLNFAIKNLKNIGKTVYPPGVNKNIYNAALHDIIIRLIGGLSAINCKSSKDRTGIELIIADAILIDWSMQLAASPEVELQYFAASKIEIEREHFVDIACQVYKSGHQLKVAGANSPGCWGIKDEGILDKDIRDKLEEDFNHSKALGNFNKPGSFSKQRSKELRIGAAVVGTIAIGLLFFFTGWLSPVGLLGLKLATYLGSNTVLGNASIVACISAVSSSFLCQRVERYFEHRAMAKYSFATQIKKCNSQKPEVVRLSPRSLQSGNAFLPTSSTPGLGYMRTFSPPTQAVDKSSKGQTRRKLSFS